ILDASNPWEVERMIYNLELTLEEMQQQALLKGKMEGKMEGKLEGELEGELKGKREVARNLLLLNVDIETIIKATGLAPEELAMLKKQLEQ
ncbi:transposase, partial [Moorella naiadis]